MEVEKAKQIFKKRTEIIEYFKKELVDLPEFSVEQYDRLLKKYGLTYRQFEKLTNSKTLKDFLED